MLTELAKSKHTLVAELPVNLLRLIEKLTG